MQCSQQQVISPEVPSALSVLTGAKAPQSWMFPTDILIIENGYGFVLLYVHVEPKSDESLQANAEEMCGVNSQ